MLARFFAAFAPTLARGHQRPPAGRAPAPSARQGRLCDCSGQPRRSPAGLAQLFSLRTPGRACRRRRRPVGTMHPVTPSHGPEQARAEDESNVHGEECCAVPAVAARSVRTPPVVGRHAFQIPFPCRPAHNQELLGNNCSGSVVKSACVAGFPSEKPFYCMTLTRVMRILWL